MKATIFVISSAASEPGIYSTPTRCVRGNGKLQKLNGLPKRDHSQATLELD
jgi:hypothetical protein